MELKAIQTVDADQLTRPTGYYGVFLASMSQKEAI